jgi:hypothetical protein
VGETRVDLLHLLEDLRDAYPGPTEETVLTEIVANSLDSGAATVTIAADPVAATVAIVDDGAGMRRRELARYHDIASSTKVRGDRIGFAGVGIKIGLLVGDEVFTETRRGKSHVATTWRLASRHRAPWKWTPPLGLVGERGTAVRLRVDSPLSPLLDPGFIEVTLRRHFQPLLEPAFVEILAPAYPRGVRFVVNGRPVLPGGWSGSETAAIAVRMPRRRRASAAGVMVRGRLPLPEDERGIAISTFGKVIKRGWDWLGITPASAEHVGGLIEVPALAECLTLNKADFIRAGSRGAVYLAYRKAIQQVVSRQLSAWGDVADVTERARRRAARPVERDLESVLVDLADEFPLLAALVERRAGGQRRLAMGQATAAVTDAAVDLVPAGVAGPPAEKGAGAVSPAGARQPTGEPAEAAPPVPAPSEVRIPGGREPRRPGRYGLSIQFEERPDDPEIARLVESTVWVNEAHPAHRRAVASRSEGYHVALASAMALAPLAVEPAKEHAFIIAFLVSWGDALHRRRSRRR